MFLRKLRAWNTFIASLLLSEDPHLRCRSDFECFKTIKEKLNCYIGVLSTQKELRILDLGCGKTFPLTFLFALEGHDVTGVDITYIVWPPSLRNYISSF
jgi:2-polyprenyl-3-methyl-5-hydroxy-6-metoxy-1,4-benzoquinol methylase